MNNIIYIMFNKKICVILILVVFFSLAIQAVSAADNMDNSSSQMGDSGGEVKSVSLKPSKLSTTYDSGKYFKVKSIDSKSKKPVSNLKISLKVQTGKKYKKLTIKTDSNGVAKYSASKLSIGKHKVIVKSKNSKAKTSSITISKAKITINAPKITHTSKDGKKFKITVKNRESKKPMAGIKVTVKIFTGKNSKSYSLKTNKNGVIKINTKSLKKGSHKVTINVKKTSKIKSASAKSTIKTVENPTYIKLKVNGHVFNVKLENNKATKELVNKLKKGNIKINANEYGGFEKVGDLGFSLPTSDKYIKTSSGDLVLYNGDEISLFYNSNSWEYTKLGKLQNVNANDLKNILGTGDVTFVLSLK